MVALWQLILAVESSQLEIVFFNLFVFLIYLVLNDCFELLLHVPNLRWDNVSESIIVG